MKAGRAKAAVRRVVDEEHLESLEVGGLTGTYIVATFSDPRPLSNHKVEQLAQEYGIAVASVEFEKQEVSFRVIDYDEVKDRADYCFFDEEVTE